MMALTIKTRLNLNVACQLRAYASHPNAAQASGFGYELENFED